MAAGVSSKTGSLHLSEIGVVFLGNDEVDESKVIKSILGCRDLTGENVGQCVLYQIEQAVKKISVVEAPGWNSMQKTLESIKKSIRRSVSLCPAGLHALLLVIPVKRNDEEPASGDIKAAEMHMELLSERVWKHTIVLFACDDGVGEFAIKAYFQKANKILEKCKGRTYILERRSKISELFTKIEELVEENRGDVLIPQTYYDPLEWKTEDLRRRRGSLDWNPPDMTKGKPDFVNDPQALLMHYAKPITVIALAVFGALLGAFAGAEYGVCAGLLLGSILAVVLAFLIFKVAENSNCIDT
ncbi:GTPase IMAP family member 4 [Sinocyclocheilus rhinocerous]|uniref:GTPase IMAP family member 4 n=1 Tax=Sinocyclocheilus rhinocerous TaxID=307959 RepID=UPI0007B910D5|nr:PREDICTED: GTPase IMAP family member 4-like [Sinocyclocheilus rhinocerous]